MRLIKAEKLKPGMVCKDWDNRGKVISNVEIIPRPNYRWANVVVTFLDGTKTKILEGSRMNIR